MPSPPDQIVFLTDTELDRRLQLLENKLLTAQAALPEMIREIQQLRARLAA